MDIKKERVIDSIIDYLMIDKIMMIEFMIDRTKEYTIEQLKEMDDSLIEYELKSLLEWQSEDELSDLSDEYGFIS
jgi:hypothetical protein